MLKKIFIRLKSFKPLRRVIIISIIIALYFVIIGLISEVLDQRAIEHELKNWFEKSLNHSTFVDIDHTDTALRSDWRTDLYIHEFEVASPDPEFILPIISIDTIRASTSFYSLFGGVNAEPVIQLRDGILNIKKNQDGAVNFESFTFDSKPTNPHFLPNIDISSIDFILMNCKIVYNSPNYQATIPINGRFKTQKDLFILKSASINSTFSTNDDGITKQYTGSIFVKSLKFNNATQDIIDCDIILEDIPATVFNMFLPTLPKLPSGLNISGNLQTIGNALVFSGQVDNLTVPSLPRYINLQLSTNKSFLSNPEYYFLEATHNNRSLLTLKANKSPDGGWEPLEQYLSYINIDDMLSGEDSSWINYFITTFPLINAVASSAILSDFDIGEAIISVIKTEDDKINISLDGDIASGKLNLLAKDISLSSNKLPKTVMATLEIKDAADTLVQFSKKLPRILDCTPTSGSGEIALLYESSDDTMTEDKIKVQLNLKNVIIPRLSGGEAINSLASLPSKLNTLNKLCYTPKYNTDEIEPELISPLPEITLDLLSVSYETNNNNAIRLSSIEAKSKELGNIHGKLYKLEGDSLQLGLNITNIPISTFEKAKLSTESMIAIIDYKSDTPLQINLIENNHKIVSEDLYIEDIYRNWLHRQTIAKIPQGDTE